MLDDVQRVIVFNATNVSKVPVACKTGTGTGQSCNALTGTQFSNLTGTSALDTNGCIVDSARKGYCPKLRNNVQLTAHYVGIWVQVQYHYEFGLLGSVKTIERTAIMRIEPP
jgi:hypothetical protein